MIGNKPKLSVCVPTHGMKDREIFFRRLLDSLWNQSFQDFEIVVADNSDDNVIYDICEYYKSGIRYIRNSVKGMAPNTNKTIIQSKGEIIKILYMDDFMANDHALEVLIGAFQGQWLVSGCIHTMRKDRINNGYWFDPHIPEYNDEIHLGKNTIGSPTVLAIKNDNPLLFDESMTWLLDCDLYKRYYEKYGEPTILKDINVVIGVHDSQMTHLISDERKLSEGEYLMKKYG